MNVNVISRAAQSSRQRHGGSEIARRRQWRWQWPKRQLIIVDNKNQVSRSVEGPRGHDGDTANGVIRARRRRETRRFMVDGVKMKPKSSSSGVVRTAGPQYRANRPENAEWKDSEQRRTRRRADRRGSGGWERKGEEMVTSVVASLLHTFKRRGGRKRGREREGWGWGWGWRVRGRERKEKKQPFDA